jgi:pantoate--beta-alanine ligase
MKIVREVRELRERVREARASGKTIGFVPTMGALHEGHFSLVRRARADAGFVVVSIFVNPLQFAPSEDLARYPRKEREDAAALEREGVDVLYLPEASAIYPPDFSTAVEVSGVSEGGEGAARPGHLRGVATVVAKLFHQVSPDVAVFGRKDLQQVAVVGRMIRDLDFPIRLVVGETVREHDGLALSSRNAYLSPEDRRIAVALPKALFDARDAAGRGEREATLLADRVRRELEAAGLVVDYVDVVDPATMAPVPRAVAGTALAAAVRVGKTRLIDNVLVP